MESLVTRGVFVGAPRTLVDAEGQEFRSAIARAPAAGPVLATRLGLVGDAVANTRVHGGPDMALCVYPASHYDRWRSESSFRFQGAPAFGENLLLEGATEAELCIGDVFEVGAAQLEITKPREPCSKLARFNHWPELPELVRREGRCGFYVRVRVEGWLSAGQPWRRMARPHPEWSVRRAHVQRHERTEGAAGDRALAALTALDPGWRRTLAARAEGVEPPPE
jgi:MOSC domain-containing protein YiiM